MKFQEKLFIIFGGQTQDNTLKEKGANVFCFICFEFILFLGGFYEKFDFFKPNQGTPFLKKRKIPIFLSIPIFSKSVRVNKNTF
jgi:hypothetical protein